MVIFSRVGQGTNKQPPATNFKNYFHLFVNVLICCCDEHYGLKQLREGKRYFGFRFLHLQRESMFGKSQLYVKNRISASQLDTENRNNWKLGKTKTIKALLSGLLPTARFDHMNIL